MTSPVGKFIDLTNMQFGRWTVIKQVDNIGSFTAWLCFCDCGTTRIVRGQDLRTEKSMSCGCIKDEVLKQRNLKHGDAGTRLYRIWKNMRTRCNNSNIPDYHNYGGRGIQICSEWDDYSNFKQWAQTNGYSDELTIDRINNNGNYQADNCRWITRAEQALNTRTNRIVETWLGDLPISKLARIIGINRKVLAYRLDNNYDEDKLFQLPRVMKRGDCNDNISCK